MKRSLKVRTDSSPRYFPESLEDYIADDNPVRVIDAFVDGLDLKQLGFDRQSRVRPADQAMNRQ